MLTVPGQQHSFSTHEGVLLWKCQSFWDKTRCNGILRIISSTKHTHWTDIVCLLTHRGRVTHICVGNLTIIGSDNGLSPGRPQAIIWTNARISLIGPLGTKFSEILTEITIFSFKKMYLKMASGKWRPFCLGLNVFIQLGAIITWYDTIW